ncbi:MAG: LytR/AlgR family response regulator transcription factor [Oscillospiraceae bacterium]
MNIAICEDEKAFAKLLSEGIQRFFSEKETEAAFSFYENGEELLQARSSEHDIIFLDINLGGSSDGMAVARLLREKGTAAPVIFVTSLENRAVDGYEVGAYGFIVKKTLDEKLPRILSKLWQEHFCRKTLAVSGRDFTELIHVDAILSVQSEGRGSVILTENQSYNDTRPIGRLSELLGEDFVETHKSVFVNISKIKRINSDTVTLCDNSSVPLSRRNRKAVMSAVMKRLGEK